MHRPKIVWETLSNIDGDIYYCDSNFKIVDSDVPFNPIPEAAGGASSKNVPLEENDE